MKITADDLYLAADWCQNYEASDDDDNGERLAAVAEWLIREAQKHEGRTAKQILQEHMEQHHPKTLGPKPRTLKDYVKEHARQHWRLAGLDHMHKGVNLGPDQRPEGWYTGEGVVMRGAQ